jgi:hypothetical protein
MLQHSARLPDTALPRCSTTVDRHTPRLAPACLPQASRAPGSALMHGMQPQPADMCREVSAVSPSTSACQLQLPRSAVRMRCRRLRPRRADSGEMST